MEGKLEKFPHEEFGEITVIEKNGEPWFIGKEISSILGYSETEKMTRRLDDDEYVNLPIWGIKEKRYRSQTVMSESGLYNAIFGSKKPEAKAFKKWVTSEVLPKIRKTGSYSGEKLSRAEQLLASVQLTVDMERRQKELEEKTQAIQEEIQEKTQEIKEEAQEIKSNQETLNAKIEGVVGGTHYFTILGYVNTLDYTENVDLKQAAALGKEATKLSKSMGYSIGSAPDVRFGKVNAYHEDVLDKLFE